MKTPEEIKKLLANHKGCIYDGNALMADALALIRQLEEREWELFNLLSSAWFTKGCYFKQEDGKVYSRVSGEYMTFDQAIDEFASELTNETQLEAQIPKWISVEERLPKRNARVVVTDGKHTWDYGQFNGLAFCFNNENPNPRKWNWKKHTVRHVEWWMPKETALPEPPKETEHD